MIKATSSSSNKKPKQANKVNAVEKQKTSLKSKRMGSEIDEIFAGKKRKMLEEEKNAGSKGKPAKSSAANIKSRDKTKIVKSSSKSKAFEGKSSSVGRTSGPRKKTGDWLTIYTEEELGFGKPNAGGTPLCPFDCNCCF